MCKPCFIVTSVFFPLASTDNWLHVLYSVICWAQWLRGSLFPTKLIKSRHNVCWDKCEHRLSMCEPVFYRAGLLAHGNVSCQNWTRDWRRIHRARHGGWCLHMPIIEMHRSMSSLWTAGAWRPSPRLQPHMRCETLKFQREIHRSLCSIAVSGQLSD